MRRNDEWNTNVIIYEDETGVIYETIEIVPNYDGIRTTYIPFGEIEILEKDENKIVVKYLNESLKSTGIGKRTEEQKKEIKKMELLFDSLCIQEKIYKNEE